MSFSNEFEVDRINQDTTAQPGQHLIGDGQTVTLPSPSKGNTILVSSEGSSVTVSTSSTIEGQYSTVYVNGDTVSFVSDGTDWFVLNGSEFLSNIPDGLVDNFEQVLYEDQNFTLSDYYTGSVADYDRQQSVVKEGSYALSVTTGTGSIIQSTSGLNTYPSAGDNFRTWGQGNDSSFRWYVQFGVQDSNNFYQIQWGNNIDGIAIEEVSSGSTSTLNSDTSVTVQTGTWREIEVQWASDSITARLLDDTGTELASTSASTTTYSSGGIGWSANAGGTTTNYYDNLRIL